MIDIVYLNSWLAKELNSTLVQYKEQLILSKLLFKSLYFLKLVIFSKQLFSFERATFSEDSIF